MRGENPAGNALLEWLDAVLTFFLFLLPFPPNTRDFEQFVKQACYLSVRIFPLALASNLMLDVIS